MEYSIDKQSYCYLAPNPYGFNYYTSFSGSTLVLSVTYGILELYARYKSRDQNKYLNFISNSIKETSQEAKSKYQESEVFISSLLELIERIKSTENSVQAFYTLENDTSGFSKYSLSNLDKGFRYLLAVIFDEKLEVKKLVLSNDDLQSIRMLILHHVSEKFGVQLDVYDSSEKESFKSQKISDFPIINLYTWNSNYYLLHTEEMYQERINPNFDIELKKGPFFMSINRKNFKPNPIQNNIPSPLPVQIDFGNDVQVLTEIIKKTAEELKENKFSNEYSKFIEECIKKNRVVSQINILKKFVNIISNSMGRGNEDSMELDSNTYLKECSICRKGLNLSYYLNTSHLGCGVCSDCASNTNYCPKCLTQYNLEDRRILRLP